MMAGIELNISDNIKDVQKTLTRLERQQLPFATALALTQTAADAKAAIDKQLPQKLDRPTRFTLNAIGVTRATKRLLESTVFVKPIQAEYLKWQIEGGVRRTSGYGTAVPTKNAKLNKFGNIPNRRKGLIRNANQFIAVINGIAGVWERGHFSKRGNFTTRGQSRSTALRLVHAFEQSVTYESILPFYKIAANVGRNVFARNLTRAVDKAIRTAK